MKFSMLSDVRRLVAGCALILLILGAGCRQAADQQQPVKAKNVVLIIGDAGGIPTLHAASLYQHNKPNALFIHSMPHLALMDTSAADAWATDSAAGMSALVTGQKTNNGILSQAANGVRGKQDGTVLKTILEYAEEKGLSTGVVTNMPMTDATAAACYAHVNNRSNTAAIVKQLLAPRFGDGPDFVAGAGLEKVTAAENELGISLAAELKKKGYNFESSPEAAARSDGRLVAIFNTRDFDLPAVARQALRTVSKDPDGYFLMVECDVHTDKLKAGLERTVVLDRIVREVSESVGPDTLVIFTADHSFDTRVLGGGPGQPLLDGDQSASSGEPPEPFIRAGDGHSAEQVLVAAKGPGAERIRGVIVNSDLFGIMMAAYGWKESLPVMSRR